MTKFRQISFVILVVLGFFLSLELFLRFAGFRYQRNLSYLQFGYPNPFELHQVFERDPKLLFKMKPGYDFKLGFGPLNSQGFRGRDFEREKPEGVFRIACLGDSVTFGTSEGSYPELLEEILAQEMRETRFQVYNFGVPGYSSWQGRFLLEKVLKEYHPDLVIILYGWNDHWQARGFSDSEQKVAPDLWLFQIRDQLARLRIYQFLNKILAELTRILFPKSSEGKFRVPVSQYEENLKAMIAQATAQGVKVILLTAPGGFGLGPLPDFFEALGFVKDARELKEIHQQYNSTVRKLAKETRVEFLDLDLIFQAGGVKNFFDHPDKDIIHPNQKGLLVIARAIAEKMKEVMNQKEGRK